ncbi:MAG: type II toxin-antitoxin system VapC family toxin [Rhodospirillaceae bacterium]
MSGLLLDTNVISELINPTPAPDVVGWVSRQQVGDLYLSAVTIGELARGVARLPGSRKRDRLDHWVSNTLPRQFEGRILPFDHGAAVIWGTLMGEGDRNGRPRSAADAQIAATALRHGLGIATRNLADFEDMGVTLINPWTAPADLSRPIE